MTQSLPDWADNIVREVSFNASFGEDIYSVGLPHYRFINPKIGVSPETFPVDMRVWDSLFSSGHTQEAGDYAQAMLIHYGKSPEAVRALTEAYLPHLPKFLKKEYIEGPWITARLAKACLDLGLDDLTDKLKGCVEKQVASNIRFENQSFLTDTRVMLHQTGTDIRKAIVGFLGELSFEANGHLHFSRITKTNEMMRAVVPAGQAPVFYFESDREGSFCDDFSKTRDFKRFKRWVNQSVESPKAIPSFWEAMTARIKKLQPEQPEWLAQVVARDQRPSV